MRRSLTPVVCVLLLASPSQGWAQESAGVFFRLPLAEAVERPNSQGVYPLGDTVLYAHRSYPSVRFEVSDIEGDVSYSLVAGSLPEGVHLDRGTGVLSGKPMEEGQWDGLVVQASNGLQSSVSAPYSLKVLGSSGLWIAPVPTLYVQTGVPVWLPIEHGAHGDWSLADESAALPTGLVVGEAGVALSGTVHVSGRYDGIVLKRSGEDGEAVSNPFTIVAGDFPAADGLQPVEISDSPAIGAGDVFEMSYGSPVFVTEVSMSFDHQRGRGLATYALEASVDGEEWQTILVLSSAATPRELESYRLPVAAVGSRFRIFPTSDHTAEVVSVTLR